MRSAFVSLLLSAWLQFPTPVFEVALWPEEGRPRFEATGVRLTLREAPSQAAPVARVVDLAAGTLLEFDETRYQTLEPGKINVIGSAVVRGRNLGAIRYLSRDEYYRGRYPSLEWQLAAGDTIEYLQYRAEGTCFVRIAGSVVNADQCSALGEASFRMIQKPRTAWWIQVVLDGSPAGWLLVEDGAVKQLGRSF